MMFRRKSKKDIAVIPDTEAGGAGESEEKEDGGNANRKMNKLAMFFGVSAESGVMDGKAEIEELLTMISGNNRDAKRISGEEQKWSRQEINQKTIFKEGWLSVKDPVRTTEHAAWISLEKSVLQIRYCETHYQDDAESNLTQTLDLSNTKTITVGSNSSRFDVVREATNECIYSFTALDTTERDEWVHVMNSIREEHIVDADGNSDTTNNQNNVNEFEFHRVLGKGKFGKVLLCSHKVSKKVFAIKVVQKDQESADTARNESEILRSIKHPFIVGLHYAFQSPERLYLVMEYANGGELFFHLSQSGRFEEPRAKFYIAEILLALQCLHGKGIVYRDLKVRRVCCHGHCFQELIA
jgi:hypothetical protein